MTTENMRLRRTEMFENRKNDCIIRPAITTLSGGSQYGLA